MNEDIQLVLNNYLPLRDVVFQTLERAILLGQLKPGERLMEIQLATRLGVSRTPIREAIRKLELEGLVVMVPRKGAQVASISEKDLNDVLEVRCSLESLALELACQRMTPSELEELRGICKSFQEAVASGDPDSIASQDVAFHDLICRISRNQRLIQLLGNLRQQMYRYRIEYIKDPSSHKTLVKEHLTILHALEKKDAEAAKKIMTNHIYNQVNAIRKNLVFQSELPN